MAYLDAVRGVALARVVLFHALGQGWVLVFAALPLMFFVAGWLFAASLDRKGPGAVTFSRFRRILPSYWVYISAMALVWASVGVLWELNVFDWVSFAMPVLFPGHPPGPGAGTDLSLTWEALWYIQMHLILALIGPFLRYAQQRWPVTLWTSLALMTGVIWVFVPVATLPLVFVAAWVLGYHHYDGQLQKLLLPYRRDKASRDAGGRHRERLLGIVMRWWWPTVIVAATVCMLFVFATAVRAGGADGTGVSKRGLQAAALGMTVLGAFWLIVAVRLQPIVEPRLRGHRTLSTITWVSQRSLTIYLWHMAAIYAALAIPLPGGSNWAGRIAWCLLGTVAAVVAFGWIEDLAARRPMSLWPTRVIDLTVAGGSSADRAQPS